MPTLTVDAVRAEGVTFVEILIEADAPCRVRLERRFEGPVWPPRTGDSIAARLADGPAVAELDAGTTAAGFATPIEVGARPVELAASEPLSGTLPEGVAAWLDRVERRVSTAERLCAAEDLPAAADAVADLGGLPAVETLAAEIERDRRLAAALDVVPAELRERLEAIDVPASAFARIARGSREA
jgi:hypothetical protein